jgi:hypothetical protein
LKKSTGTGTGTGSMESSLMKESAVNNITIVQKWEGTTVQVIALLNVSLIHHKMQLMDVQGSSRLQQEKEKSGTFQWHQLFSFAFMTRRSRPPSSNCNQEPRRERRNVRISPIK